MEFKYTVTLLCEIAGVKRKAYYNFRDKPIKKEDPIEKIIIQIYNKSKGIFGYRRIGNELRNVFKIVVNHKKIQRIMQENNLRSRIRRKKNKIHDDKQFKENILNRNFEATKPGEKIATDITCIPYRNSKLYLCVALDLFNNEPVSWEYSKNPDSKLTVKTIEKLSKKIDIKNTIIHSDQGVQYTSKEYSNYLKSLGAVQSMSRRGNCWDNAKIESFFSHYKTESINLYKKRIKSFEDIKEITEDYIKFYINDRTQRNLGGVPPRLYKQIFSFN